MPFLLAEILNFQGSTHRIGVGSFSNLTIINSFEIKRVIHFKIILTLGLFHVNKF